MWNEPNLPGFWAGADQDAYHRLYAVTAAAVKDVDAGLQVGGPSLAPGYQPHWMTGFAAFAASGRVAAEDDGDGDGECGFVAGVAVAERERGLMTTSGTRNASCC